MQGTDGAIPDDGGDRLSSIREMAALAGFAAWIEPDGERTVLGLAGEFDHSKIEAAQVSLEKAVAQSPSGSIVIDMRELMFIDSTGISFLVRAIQDRGRKLAIRESEAVEVRRVLALVGIPDFAITDGGIRGEPS